MAIKVGYIRHESLASGQGFQEKSRYEMDVKAYECLRKDDMQTRAISYSPHYGLTKIL